MNKRIYIIEDDKLSCDTIAAVINECFDDFKIVSCEGDGEIAIKECISLKPDLAIVDIRLPGVNGLEILHILKKRSPQTKILIYSGILNLNTIKHAYHGKAEGIMEKPGTLDLLRSAIETVLSGEVYYSPTVLETLLSLKTTDSQGENQLPVS